MVVSNTYIRLGAQKKFVVVDYDPEVIESLERNQIDFMYGDASDPELLAELNVDKIKLLVNTVRDHDPKPWCGSLCCAATLRL